MPTERDSTPFEESLRPALDAYRAEVDRHFLTSYEAEDGCVCKCGWAPPSGARRPRVSLGMHIKAASVAADAAYDARVAELVRRRSEAVRTEDGAGAVARSERSQTATEH